MSSAMYLHMTAKTTVISTRQSDGWPLLQLETKGYLLLTVFGPSMTFEGPAALVAFAEMLADAANEFLVVARECAAETALSEVPVTATNTKSPADAGAVRPR